MAKDLDKGKNADCHQDHNQSHDEDNSGRVNKADIEGSSPKPDKSKKKKNKKKKKRFGSRKAVETMFRNATRVELDLITVAATKADIMISLNSVIISALMISGTFIFASSPTFIIPAGIFMVMALVSLIFAILSASPEKANFFNGFVSWMRAFIKREAKVSDLQDYLDKAKQFGGDKDLNLLIYTDRVRLSRQAHWDEMQSLIQSREEVYRSMSNQLYWLGHINSRKFKFLSVSYSAFLWGLLVSALLSLILHSLFFMYPDLLKDSPSQLTDSGMGAFSRLYEPSGAQQLPDGSLLVVEDEAERAMNIMSVGADGSLIENAISNFQLTRSFGRKLNDLEGLAADAKGFIYATTSHSSDEDGQRKPAREQLLRFNMQGSKAGNIATLTTLRDDLANSTLIAAAIKARTGEDADFDELDIEGLAYVDSTGELLLGLRQPVVADLTMIIPIINSTQVFENKVPPKFAEPMFLDIKGGGIRSLHFDNNLESFIIANEIENEKGKKFSQIWIWNGDIQEDPIPVDLPELLDLKNIEAISTITVNKEPKLVFMADEGDADKGTKARYMILDYDRFTKYKSPL